jgi:hypothetical protein
MQRVTLGRIALIVALVEALALLHLWFTQDIVLISEPSPDNKYIAQVVMTREFPYIGVEAYLVIRDASSGHVDQKHFLSSRDVLLDVVIEIHSLGWSDGVVNLDIESAHYSGPKTFFVQ